MVQIITDSSTLYTIEEGKKLGFEVLPLCVSIGDLEGRDLSIDMDDFYARIEKGEVPRSSQPPIGEVMDVYEKYSQDEIINIAMADGLSGTYQSACGAREMADNKEKITVINTKTLCGPHRYLAEKAQQMKMEGFSAKEIVALAGKIINEHINLFMDMSETFAG
ncbi:MAG: DegV family EDD domain-containing protein, partial [Lachnospiraceae bacterium]|nr:DegV family EDD domain-containing protein [Lachnospiraceae bacterium]